MLRIFQMLILLLSSAMAIAFELPVDLAMQPGPRTAPVFRREGLARMWARRADLEMDNNRRADSIFPFFA